MPVTSALLSAAPAMMKTGAGLAQTIIGGIGAHRAQKQLENLQTPFYQPNKGIQDYYQESLNKYYTSPYASQMYQQAQKNINERMATGISALQDRRSALAGIPAIVEAGNRGGTQALVAAEGQRNKDFQTLGTATNMLAGDQRLQYQYNQLMPYQKRLSILGAKAAAANQMLSAGMQNLFGGASQGGQIAGSMIGQGGAGGGGASYASLPGLADTGGGVPSPAAGVGFIDPNMSLPLIGG